LKVSDIDQRLWDSEEHAGSITAPHRQLSVTESAACSRLLIRRASHVAYPTQPTQTHI
jgi:hypothetical protein